MRPLKAAIKYATDNMAKEAAREMKELAADKTELALAKLELLKADQRRACFREMAFWREVLQHVKKGMTLKDAVALEIDETAYRPPHLRLLAPVNALPPR